jgi:hypothetical protein
MHHRVANQPLPRVEIVDRAGSRVPPDLSFSDH